MHTIYHLCKCFKKRQKKNIRIQGRSAWPGTCRDRGRGGRSLARRRRGCCDTGGAARTCSLSLFIYLSLLAMMKACFFFFPVGTRTVSMQVLSSGRRLADLKSWVGLPRETGECEGSVTASAPGCPCAWTPIKTDPSPFFYSDRLCSPSKLLGGSGGIRWSTPLLRRRPVSSP